MYIFLPMHVHSLFLMIIFPMANKFLEIFLFMTDGVDDMCPISYLFSLWSCSSEYFCL